MKELLEEMIPMNFVLQSDRNEKSSEMFESVESEGSLKSRNLPTSLLCIARNTFCCSNYTFSGCSSIPRTSLVFSLRLAETRSQHTSFFNNIHMYDGSD